MDDYHYLSYSQEVIFGRAAVTRMSEALHHIGLRRVMLCTDADQAANGHAALVEQALGDHMAVMFERVPARVEDLLLDNLVVLAKASDVDCVLGLGGSAPIGMAKAISFTLEQALTGRGVQPPSAVSQPAIPVAAIPTTYSGAEMTSAFSMVRLREQPQPPVTTYDPRIAPRLVVYDPELTLDLSPRMTASSGIHALAHCFEALYSITRHPLSTAASLGGIRKISGSLLACFERGGDLGARTEMLAGAQLAGFAFASVAMGLHHGLCQVLAQADGVPHGYADSIILPWAIRFNAEVPSFDRAAVADALGFSPDGRGPGQLADAIARRIAELCAQLGLPARLRDVGIAQAELHALAERAFEDLTLQNNPRRIPDQGPIEELLNEAW